MHHRVAAQAAQAFEYGSASGVPSVGPAAVARGCVSHGVQTRHVLVCGILGVDAYQHARVRADNGLPRGRGWGGAEARDGKRTRGPPEAHAALEYLFPIMSLADFFRFVVG